MEIILPLKKKGNSQKYLETFFMLFIKSQVILFSEITEKEQGLAEAKPAGVWWVG